jgi:hypothetical protein
VILNFSLAVQNLIFLALWSVCHGEIDFECRIYINMVEGTSGYTIRDLWVACHKNLLPSTKRAVILISMDALRLLMMQQSSLMTSCASYVKNLDLSWRIAPSCTLICIPSSMTSLRMLLHMVWPRSQIVWISSSKFRIFVLVSLLKKTHI